ncbi:putative serine/threonine-protein kinase haspin homolog, partial [Formica exsecta]|uniref:putative serine/threonine-protein kinase haspin homolog n=1 Tax=Formica exsecta TaxID=72781 RepID=UPI001143BE1E
EFKYEDVNDFTLETIKSLPYDGEYGYTFLVDLDIPLELHDKFKNSPMLPEHYVPSYDELSEYQKELISEGIDKIRYEDRQMIDDDKVLVFFKKIYGDKAKLLETDTDSFIIYVETDDLYMDIKNNIHYFDTSDYKIDWMPQLSMRYNGNESTAHKSLLQTKSQLYLNCINTTTGCKIKDTSFLEAFGIKSEKSPSLKLSHRKESHDNQIIKGHSTTARDVVLQRCSQNSYLSFSYCFPDSYLEYCRKIGEGVYGEVFLYEYFDKKSVIKIIPIEGEKLVNGEAQKKFNEILSEIVIAKELDNLRLNTTYKTSGFVEVRSIKCIVGKYPKRLVELWNTYDDNKTSDNDCPSMFDENQLYIALELGDGGEDLEAFVFQTAEEACALFLQTAFALAVAEKAFEFEHRDLHWGNLLISRTKEPYVYYNLDEKEIRLPSKGVKVSIIDFTLSRMLYQGCCIYNDLALDPALFTAHGEYQFEIYRLMREKIQNNWNKFEPYTNILWLHYTLDKMITSVRYKRKNLKVHKHAILRLKEFKDIILKYDSVFDFATDSSVAHL